VEKAHVSLWEDPKIRKNRENRPSRHGTKEGEKESVNRSRYAGAQRSKVEETHVEDGEKECKV